VTALFIWALLFVIGANSQVAFAQTVGEQISSSGSAVPPASRPRVSDDELLKGQSVPASFDKLQPILAPGYEVVVWDAAGRKTRGRVSSISADQVVVYQRAASPLIRLFNPPKDRLFPADSVTRIDIVDSTWNGALIGAAVAPVLVFGIHRWEGTAVSDSNSMKGIATVVFGGISAVLAIGIGQKIDSSINQPVYQRRRGIPPVTLTPWLDPTRTGVLARVRF
jgi:hypothetical protein